MLSCVLSAIRTIAPLFAMVLNVESLSPMAITCAYTKYYPQSSSHTRARHPLLKPSTRTHCCAEHFEAPACPRYSRKFPTISLLSVKERSTSWCAGRVVRVVEPHGVKTCQNGCRDRHISLGERGQEYWYRRPALSSLWTRFWGFMELSSGLCYHRA